MRCGAPDNSHSTSCIIQLAVGVKRATPSEAAAPFSPLRGGEVLPSSSPAHVLAGYRGGRIRRYRKGEDGK